MHKAERNETTTKSFKRLEKTETSLPCRFFRPTSCGIQTQRRKMLRGVKKAARYFN